MRATPNWQSGVEGVALGLISRRGNPSQPEVYKQQWSFYWSTESEGSLNGSEGLDYYFRNNRPLIEITKAHTGLLAGSNQTLCVIHMCIRRVKK